MRGVRVQVQGSVYLVDVVCDCGANGLADAATGETSFKHPVVAIPGEKAKVLVCEECWSEYEIVPQLEHVHVVNHVAGSGDKVLFWGGKHNFLSNFSAYPVLWRHETWPTSEHAYQSAKFPIEEQELIDRIRRASSPGEAKRIARQNEDKVVKEWDGLKEIVMASILNAKLKTHPELKEKLLATGNREIVENSPTDSFWGRGPDWKGENRLGKLWMMLREELRDKK